MANIVCIVCPKGCRLTVDETTFEVVGNNCPRGAAYGKAELTSPTRVITSTVKVEKGDICRCPVRTKGAIPKGKMFDIMSALRKVTLVSPVKIGDVVIPNVCDTGIDVIATRNV